MQPLCEESSMLIGQALAYRGDTLHWIHPEILSNGFEMSSCYYSGKKKKINKKIQLVRRDNFIILESEEW